MASPWLKLLDPGLTALKAAAGTSFDDRLALARAFNGRARHDEAREILDRLLAEDRAHAEAWFERLLCFSEHDGEEEGLELLTQLESLRDEHPQDGGHLRNLASLRLLLQDPEGAERALHQALALNGQDAKALELAGLVHLHLDHPSDAKAWLLKALSLNPKDPRTLRLLAIAMEQLGDVCGAEAQLVAAAAKQGISLEGASMYVTTFPCPPCAKLVAYSGIKKLYYADGYGVLDGERVLKSQGVEIVFVKMQ